MNVPMFVMGVVLVVVSILGWKWWQRTEKELEKPKHVGWWE